MNERANPIHVAAFGVNGVVLCFYVERHWPGASESERSVKKGRGILGWVGVIWKAMKLEELVAEASRLSEEERASVASQLLHGLETPVYCVSDEEVRGRMREADGDPSVLITFDQLVAGLRHRGS